MSALFPKRIEVNDASVAQLEALFTASSQDLHSYLVTLNSQNISRSRIAQVRSQIQQRLATLGVAVGSWVVATVPRQYAQGQYDAARQQSHFGEKAAAVTILAAIANKSHVISRNATFEAKHGLSYIPGKVVSPTQKMFDLHKQSVQGIMDSMSKSFEDSLNSMARSADMTINKIQALNIRRAIAEQAHAGTDTSAISKQITDIIKNSDISALVDKGGRTWSPESYANMLTRTKLVEARNNGMMNALTSVGHDLVEVSAHGAIDACGDWEGAILSISGDSANYDTVDDAITGGLFHPNCEHSLNAVNPADYPA